MPVPAGGSGNEGSRPSGSSGRGFHSFLSGSGESDEVYRRSNGLLYTPEMTSIRQAAAMARWAHEQGRLRDGTIGVLLGEGAESRLPGDGALIPQLEQLGYEIAQVSRLSADLQTAQSQILVQIAEMRRKGVDRILTVANAILMGIWFNQAEGQGYRPLYVLSDVQAGANDFTVQSAPVTLRAVAYTIKRQGEVRRDLPHQREAADCLARYNARSGDSVERGSTAYEQVVKICGQVEVFRRAAAAGTDLTGARWLAGLAGLGTFTFPDLGGTLSFGPQKFDGADFMRTKQFDGACRCYLPVDDFSRA